MATRDFARAKMERGPSVAGEQGIFIDVLTVNLNPASVGADATLTENFTVAGLDTGDVVILKPTADISSLMIAEARVSAADTLRVTWENETAAPIDLAATDFKLIVIRVNK